MPALIVAGFHRSGTSLFTELLHSAGLFVGDDLLGALPSNPYGHFEDREVMKIHKAIMSDNGFDWQVDRPFLPFIASRRWAAMQEFVDARRLKHRLWGFKDPRVCFFLGAWTHLIPESRVVIVYRDPAACVSSIHRRQTDDLIKSRGNAAQHRRFWAEPDLGLRMWIAHNKALLEFADRHASRTMVVSFSALSQGFPIVDAIRERWSLGLQSLPTASVFDPGVATGPAPLRLFDSGLLDDVDDLLTRFEHLDVARASQNSVNG